MKTLLIDHDDSFTFNLRDWLRPLCADVEVLNHRDLASAPKADLVVLSPGPHNPQTYPHVLEYVQTLPNEVFVYGVCLGLQMMVTIEGGKIETYSPPLHGKKSRLNMNSEDYKNLHQAQVARYHSLKCSQIPSGFELIATADDDHTPMWLRHKQKKWMGVQFHPESFLTEHAVLHQKALANWVKN